MTTLRSLRACGAAVCAVMLCGAARGQAKPRPDTIVFVNGDQLTGRVVRGVGDAVVFKSDVVGEITVPLAKIRELRSTQSFAVLRKGMKPRDEPLHAAELTVADGNLTVQATGGPVVVPAKDVGYVIEQATYDRELRHQGFLRGWEGSLSGGATLVRSTTAENNFTLGVKLQRVMPTLSFLPRRNRTTLNVLDTYGKQTSPVIPPTFPAPPDVVVKTSIFHADGERDEYFSQRFYALADASLDHNYAQGLSLQQTYGGGVGVTLLKQPKQQLDAKVDAHFERQSFLPPTPGGVAAPAVNLVGATLGEMYRRELPKKLIFKQDAQFLPAFNKPSAFSLVVNASLLLPVYKRLGMQLAGTDNFLNNPPVYFKKNSFQFVTSVTYSLR